MRRGPPPSPSTRRDSPTSPKPAGASPTLTRAGSTARIDSNNAPRPLYSSDPLGEAGGPKIFSDQSVVPPFANSGHTVIDRGVASCRYLRATPGCICACRDAHTSTSLPIALLAQPIPSLGVLEPEPPVVDLGTESPPRCPRCKCYPSPQWRVMGSTATCPFCDHTFAIPEFYQYLFENWHRVGSAAERPELQFGTVDYRVEQKIKNFVFCFVVEVTPLSLATGVLFSVLSSLELLIGSVPNDCKSSISIITFDSTIHFHSPINDLKSSVSVVTNVDDPFVPVSTAASVVPIVPKRDCICQFLRTLSSSFRQSTFHLGNYNMVASAANGSAGHAALSAAVDLVASAGGGTVICIFAGAPNFGFGGFPRTPPREDSKSPLMPRPELKDFVSSVESRAVEGGVCVDIFCCPPADAQIDVGALGCIPRATGGRLYYIPAGFEPARDAERLHWDIWRILSQPQGVDCLLRLRTSKGLRVKRQHSPWLLDASGVHTKDQASFHIPRVNCDTCIVFEIEHEGGLENATHALVQTAMLFSRPDGQRRLRVSTLIIPTSQVVSSSYRSTDVETLLTLFTRRAATGAALDLAGWKESSVDDLTNILFSYRLNVASTSPTGQLILPESVRTLPALMSGLFKSAAFREARGARADHRAAQLIDLLSLPPSQLAMRIYPRLVKLCRAGEANTAIYGRPTGVELNCSVPPSIPASGERVSVDAVYVLDGGDEIFVYFGRDVETQVVEELVAMGPSLATPVGQIAESLKNIIKQFRKERPIYAPYAPVRFTFPRTLDESQFIWRLVEDRLGGEVAFTEFLVRIHKDVQRKVEDL